MARTAAADGVWALCICGRRTTRSSVKLQSRKLDTLGEGFASGEERRAVASELWLLHDDKP